MQSKIIFADTPGANEVQEENSRYQQVNSNNYLKSFILLLLLKTELIKYLIIKIFNKFI